jgi:ocular albinism type 1 protein
MTISVFSCHDIHDLGTALSRVMPNYILNYGTIVFVMLANPIIYYQCSKEVDKQLVQRYGQYTNNERQIHDLFKIKFSLLNLIFYICWLPNIINAILMWTMWFHLPIRVIIISWYVMAVLNPLQALFNSLVYRKWNSKLNCFIALKNYITKKLRGNVVNASPSPNETSPLLHDESQANLSSANHPDDEDVNFRRYSIQCPCV